MCQKIDSLSASLKLMILLTCGFAMGMICGTGVSGLVFINMVNNDKICTQTSEDLYYDANTISFYEMMTILPPVGIILSYIVHIVTIKKMQNINQENPNREYVPLKSDK